MRERKPTDVQGFQTDEFVDGLIGDWLTHPANWDICDLHEEAFPMGDRCPKCSESDAKM
jgi:hypothetical protein